MVRSAQAAMLLTASLAVVPGLARAQSPVEILGVADEDRREAIRAILPDRDRPETLFDAERIAEEAAQKVRLWLRSEGYYGGAAVPIATPNPPRAAVEVDFGAPYLFAPPRAEYAGRAPPEEVQLRVREALATIAAGELARAEVVLAAEAAAVAALQAAGYPEAEAGERLAVVDHGDETMTVTLRLAPGRRAFLGEVRLAEGARLRQSYLDNLHDWERGEPYSPEEILTLRRDLTQTGAFEGVGVALAEEGEDGLSDVVVTLEPARPYQLSLGASFSTTEGGGATADFLIRNPTRRADSLTLTLTAAELQQRLAAVWRRPNALGRGRTLAILGEISRDDVLPFERQGVRFGAEFEPRDDVRLATSFGGEVAADIFDQAAGVENALVLSVFGAVRYDTTDSELDPRRGFILEAREAPSVSTGDASLLFSRTTASASAYTSPFGPRFTLAGRLGFGWVQPLFGDADRLPLNRRFFAGGGGSVRGYEFRSIFPSAAPGTEEPPGGQGLLESTVEGRFRFSGRLGAAVFADSGAAFNNFGEIQPLYGVGAGLRYDLGFGPLRIDFATALSDAPGAQDVAFYFSLGQAF